MCGCLLRGSLLLAFSLILSPALRAQVVLSEVLFDPVGVDTGRQVVELRNTGPAAAEIGGYWLSFKPAAWQFPPGAVLPPGGLAVVHLNRSGTQNGTVFHTGTSGMRNLRRDDAISLFRRNLFSDPTQLLGFVGWGGPSQVGEEVAVEAGLWSPGDTVPVHLLREGSSIAHRGSGQSAAAWCVDGNPTIGGPNDECALSFARSPVKLNEVKPGPSGIVELKNTGEALEDLGGKWLVSNTSAYSFPPGTLVLPGRLLLLYLGSSGVNGEDHLYTGPQFPDLERSGAVALLAGPRQTDPTLVLDFIQWGSSGGPLERPSVEAGLWPAGAAVSVDALRSGGSLAALEGGEGPARFRVDNTPTPGEENRSPPGPLLVLNEVLILPGDGEGQAVELWNPGRRPVDLSGFSLCTRSDAEPGSPACLALPEDAVVEPGRFLVVPLEPEVGPPGGRFPFPHLDHSGDEVALLISQEVGEPNNFLDYLRWGEGAGPLERTASAAGLWTEGESIEVSGAAAGSSLAYLGVGRGPLSYRIDDTPSLGRENEERPPERNFVRSDCNQDGFADISDAIAFFGFMFGDGQPAPCGDACDSNDDGSLDISDPIHILSFLFLGGASKPPAACGPDDTPEGTDCVSFRGCAP